MSDEREGQMRVFTLDGCEPAIQAEHADETCACTGFSTLSLAELITAYGYACAELEWTCCEGKDQNRRVAERVVEEFLREFSRRDLRVTYGDPA